MTTEKMKDPKFWFMIVGAIMLVLQIMGVKVDAPYINEVITSISAVLIMLGIFKKPPEDEEPKDEKTE